MVTTPQDAVLVSELSVVLMDTVYDYSFMLQYDYRTLGVVS